MDPFWQKILTNHLAHFFLKRTFILLYVLLSALSVYSQDATRNRKPRITGQTQLAINEGEFITIGLTDLTVEDPDDWFYPWGFSMAVHPGVHYTFNGLTITPSRDFEGTLVVTVTVNDGDKDSEPYGLQITVNGINDAPIIENQTDLTVDEDHTFTLSAANLVIYDPEQSEFTLSASPGDHYSIEGLTVTPEQNYSGQLTIPVKVSDGLLVSNEYRVLVNVAQVNDGPKINGQQEIVANEDESFALSPTHLVIEDPDNADFVLNITQGEHFTINNGTIIPETNYSGTLNIPVTVSDQTLSSSEFPVSVTITPLNDKPRIISHQSFSVEPSSPLPIELSHLTVEDPDNTYPDDFSLLVLSGDHYTVSGNTVTANETFEGSLSVMVRVNDGEAESESFPVVIEIKKGKRKPIITNQEPIIINEDQSFTIELNHLDVEADDDYDYPEDFSLMVEAGENYTVSGTTVKPSANFFGSLFVKVKVTDGKDTSPPFNFQITVNPLNDAPVISTTDPDSAIISREISLVHLVADIAISDIDNKELTLAEIEIDAADYDPANDALRFTNTDQIKGVFDAPHGILALIGKATIEQYREAIKSVELALGSAQTFSKKIRIKVSDGEASSNAVTRLFYRAPTNSELTIPSGFTPNGDLVNDTWTILPAGSAERFFEAQVRVYTKGGLLVFEADDLTKAWDGFYHGSLLPSDVYYYTIDFKTDPLQPSTLLKGIVTILR